VQRQRFLLRLRCLGSLLVSQDSLSVECTSPELSSEKSTPEAQVLTKSVDTMETGDSHAASFRDAGRRDQYRSLPTFNFLLRAVSVQQTSLSQMLCISRQVHAPPSEEHAQPRISAHCPPYYKLDDPQTE
jgi:hypothetical protein